MRNPYLSGENGFHHSKIKYFGVYFCRYSMRSIIAGQAGKAISMPSTKLLELLRCSTTIWPLGAPLSQPLTVIDRRQCRIRTRALTLYTLLSSCTANWMGKTSIWRERLCGVPIWLGESLHKHFGDFRCRAIQNQCCRLPWPDTDRLLSLAV